MRPPRTYTIWNRVRHDPDPRAWHHLLQSPTLKLAQLPIGHLGADAKILKLCAPPR